MNSYKRFRTDQSLIVTGRTVIHDGPDLAIFSVLSVEPLNGGEEGVLNYRLTSTERSLTSRGTRRACALGRTGSSPE